ncbi:MAG: flagellar basal body P-ring formation chaperone FlgA [Pseudomonadota bacterium]
MRNIKYIIRFSILIISLINITHLNANEAEFIDVNEGVVINHLKQQIIDELQNNYIPANKHDLITNYELDISERYIESLPSNVEDILDIKIDNFRFNHLAFNITSNIDNKITENKIYAKIFISVNIPTLNQRLAKGDIIEQQHISFKEFPLHRVAQQYILDAEELLNMQAKNNINIGKPVRASAIIKPQIVNRNEIVAVIYKHKYIELETIGIALNAGALGDNIRVKNKNSGKIISAIAAGKSKVVASRI